MPSPELGRIIWVELDDPQGRNRKERPAVIINSTEEIKKDGIIVVVACSTDVSPTNKEKRVDIPWHNNRHPKTRLNKPTAAVCDWLGTLTEADILEYAGIVPTKHLAQILKKVAELRDQSESSAS